MAAEAGFDMKIRIVEFATSLKEAEEGRYQAYMLNWSGRTDPDGNLYIFHEDERAAELRRLLESAGRQGCSTRRASRATRRSARRSTRRSTEKLLNEGPYLYLFHRKVLIAHSNEAGGIQADARRARAPAAWVRC